MNDLKVLHCTRTKGRNNMKTTKTKVERLDSGHQKLSFSMKMYSQMKRPHSRGNAYWNESV